MRFPIIYWFQSVSVGKADFSCATELDLELALSLGDELPLAFGINQQDVITSKLLELSRGVLLALAAGGFAAWLYNTKVGFTCATMVLLFEELSRWGTTAHTDVGQGLFHFLGIALLAIWLTSPSNCPL